MDTSTLRYRDAVRVTLTRTVSYCERSIRTCRVRVIRCSRNLANEVTKGMTEKAITGGTNGKAPIGYLNVTKRDELGREIRTVEIDETRAPLVRWAFEAYATGNYSTITLHEALIDRGLMSVPTPKRPSKPPVLSAIQKMLSNPYYKGTVSFRGTSYDGMHEPLVPTEVWYRVQAVLNAKQNSGEKTQAHDHYLKGTLYCGVCDSRLILTHAKSRRGVIYPYFICAGRHSKRTECERKSMFVPDIEAAVEDYYRRIQIPEHIVTALRTLITDEFDRLHAAAIQERHAHTIERDALRNERGKLLQAHYAGAVPVDLLKTEQDRIGRRLAWLDVQIEASSTEYEQAKAHLEDCLALAGDCHKLYMSIDDSLRRICNQAFFEKIWVKKDSDTVKGEPGQPFNVLFNPEVHTLALDHEAQGSDRRIQTENVAGLNNELLVELRGFEPLTFSLRTRRATNCAIAPRCSRSIGNIITATGACPSPTCHPGSANATNQPRPQHHPQTPTSLDPEHPGEDHVEARQLVLIVRRACGERIVGRVEGGQ